MKQLQLIFATLLLAAFLSGPVLSQVKQQQAPKKETALKEHKCTAACKNGKHVYAHGEKGLKCGPECKKMMEKTKA